MSMFAPATPLVTTFARRLAASVTSAVGSAFAVVASIDAVDEAPNGPLTPKISVDRRASARSRSSPKSNAAIAVPATPIANAASAAITTVTFRIRTLLSSVATRDASRGCGGSSRWPT